MGARRIEEQGCCYSGKDRGRGVLGEAQGWLIVIWRISGGKQDGG